MISTEINRVYNTRPVNGNLYYVWETNELWTFSSNKWQILIGNTRTSSGYYYTDGHTLDGTNDDTVIDNNGLLKDGSVVIRDDNRIIKGKLYVDRTNNNLVISSFLGGGIRLLPNGSQNSLGSLLINPNTIVYFVDRETGKQLSRDDIDKYIDDKIEEIINEEISKAEESKGVPLSTSEKESIRNEVNNRPLLKQEIMQEKTMSVSAQMMDGYAIYNGTFIATEEFYVQRLIPSDKSTSGYTTGYEKVNYKVYHEGDFDFNKLSEEIKSIRETVSNLSNNIPSYDKLSKEVSNMKTDIEDLLRRITNVEKAITWKDNNGDDN